MTGMGSWPGCDEQSKELPLLQTEFQIRYIRSSSIQSMPNKVM